MLVPLAIALASHVAGGLLGLGGRVRSLGALHTFALVSALVVVLAQLLPDALGAIGLWALLLFFVGAVFPSAIGRLTSALGKSSTSIGLEMGYAGLVVHQIADGVGLGAYSGAQHEGHSHLDVMLALSAHMVPMIAVVAMVYQRRGGWRSAILRVGGLAIATVLGVVVTAIVPARVHETLEPWVAACVGGLLLHVLAHDWESERRPHGLGERAVDLVAIVAGIALVFVGGQGHEGSVDLRADIAGALYELSLQTAPALLIGLAIGALLSAWGSSRFPSLRLGAGGPLRQALTGASIGGPLPICACGVLPLAQALRQRGAAPALVVAFLIATPELGVETFALTGRLIGWPFAFVRLAAAIVLAVIMALVVHRATRGTGAAVTMPETPAREGSFAARALASFDELVQHVAPWTLVGLVAAAYVQAALGESSLHALRGYGLDVLVVTLVAVPSYVCAASATPVAAVLLMKGMSPGAVLVGLLLGPATNLATIGFVRKSYGMRAAVIGVAAIVLVAWGLAFALQASGIEATPSSVPPHEHGWLTFGAAILCAAALLRGIWRMGLRGWLSTLGESFGSGAHHHHDHHDHEHHHDHERVAVSADR